LTLPEDLRAALDEFSEVLGKPVATLTVELLREMIPQIEGITKMARASKSGNKAAAKRALVHMVGDQMAEIMASTQPDMFPKVRK
jgi:hypothetical protein